MEFLKYTFLLILISILQFPMFAQDWVSYQSQENINDLVDTGNELIMATGRGLVVMDKSTLETSFFDTYNSSLPSNHINSITRGLSGNTWIGTYDARIAMFDGNDFQEETLVGNTNPNTIELYDIKEAPNGDLWVGTNQGVFHRVGQTWNQYDQDDIGADFGWAWDIEINDAGEVFVGSNFIHKFSNGVWTNISSSTQLVGYLHADLFFNSAGDLFFLGDLDKIGRYDGTQWQEYDNTGLNGSQILRFSEDINGVMYFNTSWNGIFKLENDVWTSVVDAQTEAYGNETSFMHIDAQNKRWLNKNIHLSVNDNGNIQSALISEYTLETNNIFKIQRGGNGNMFFITGSDEHISVVDSDGNWSFFPYPSSLISFLLDGDILYQSDNDVWIASNMGLHHYDGSDWTMVKDEACKSILVNSQGKIYVRGTTKIYMFDDGIETEYSVDNSPMSSYFLSGHGIDANDNLWMSFFDWDGNNAIQMVSPQGNWTTYDGLVSPVIERPVGNFHFDVNGNVWVPEDNVGVLMFDGTTWTNPYVGNTGLMANYQVHTIESDAAGKLYFAHQYGVTTYMDGEWEDVLVNHIPNAFDSSDSEIKFDDEGTLWWGNNRHGVFSYTPVTSTSIANHIKEDLSLSIYPNPVLEYTTVGFTLEEKSTVNISIYNYLGQLQLQKDLGQLSIGDFQEHIHMEHLPKGFYVLELQVNNKSATQKLLKE